MPDAVLVFLCGLLNLRRCGCSIIARSTSRLGLSLECSSSLPPNPAQRSWLGTPVCFRLPARSKACGGLFVRACWVCGPWWRMSGVRVVSVSGSLPRAPNGRAETRVAQKACLAQCEQGETPKVLLGAMPARCTMASHTSKHVVVVVLLPGSRLGVACSCDSFTWLVLDGAAFRFWPKQVTLRPVPRVSFVASFEPCPAALAWPSRMLPLACTRLGVRGADRPGVLGLRTVVADERCLGPECCLARCLA